MSLTLSAEDLAALVAGKPITLNPPAVVQPPPPPPPATDPTKWIKLTQGHGVTSSGSDCLVGPDIMMPDGKTVKTKGGVWNGFNVSEVGQVTYDGIKHFKIRISWRNFENAQGHYNFQPFADFLLWLMANHPGMQAKLTISTAGGGGYTAAGAATAKYSGDMPDYILHCGGSLTSTDGTMTTKSFPKSPIPGVYGFWPQNFIDPNYNWGIGSIWTHPIPVRCFVNMMQALAKFLVGAGVDKNGVKYPAATMDDHIYLGGVDDWDELAIALGAGPLGLPAADTGVMVGCKPGPGSTPWIGASGGTPYVNINGQKIADVTAAEIYDMKALRGEGTAAAFQHTRVNSCFSYGIGMCRGPSGTWGQLRAFIERLSKARVEIGSQDMYPIWFAIANATGKPWTDNGPFPCQPAQHNGAFLIVAGAAAQLESTSGNGPWVIPGNGPVAADPAHDQPAGKDYRPIFGKSIMMGDGDVTSYLQKGVVSTAGIPPAAPNISPAAIKGLYQALMYIGAQSCDWPRTDRGYSNASWLQIQAGIKALGPWVPTPVPSMYSGYQIRTLP